MKIKVKLLLGMLIVSLLLPGCGATALRSEEASAAQSGIVRPKGGLPEDTQLYTIRLDGQDMLTFDADGNVAAGEEFITLTDLSTGAPQCRLQRRKEDTGERNADGYPIVRSMAALYDLDGTMLHNYEETDYAAAFGDFLIRGSNDWDWNSQENVSPDRMELWNFKTGQTVLKGIGFLEPLDADGSRWLALNSNSELQGVINRDGTVISGFPPEKQYGYATAWNGKIITMVLTDPETDNKESVLLSENLEPILTGKALNGSYYGLRGEYLLEDEGENRGVLDETGKLCYTTPDGCLIEYFDGELVVLNEDVGGNRQYRLEKVDGTLLASGYSRIDIQGDYSSKEPVEAFLGLRGSQTVEKLDRTGKVVASINVPSFSFWNQSNTDYLICATDEGSAELLDRDLKVLIPLGQYTDLINLQWYDGKSWSSTGLWECHYNVQEDTSGSGLAINRIALLDSSFHVLADGISSIQGVGPNRLAVVRGFSAGLMDWDGKWIAKESIFQSINDDDMDWGAF